MSEVNANNQKNILTAIRFRPDDSDEAVPSVWCPHDMQCVENLKTRHIYEYDRVYDCNTSTQSIFEEMVLPIVHMTLDGMNGTIFAYGQTYSGKTYTMFGDESNESRGIVHLAIEEIFDGIARETEKEFMVLFSCVEIYNETLYDLLSEETKVVTLSEHSGSVHIKNAEEMPVGNFEQIFSILTCIMKKRRVASTALNERSSRSHCVLQLKIESRMLNSDEDSCSIGILHLIDLAGSENIELSKVEGLRLRETKNINVSLFQLTNVIRALSCKENFISYRNSLLTRLLKTSLSGNANILVLACIRAMAESETKRTLMFAQNARCVMVRPRVNVILSDEAALKVCRQEIEELKSRLALISEDNDMISLKNKVKEEVQLEFQEKLASLEKLLLRGPKTISSPLTEPRPIKRKRRETWAPTSDFFFDDFLNNRISCDVSGRVPSLSHSCQTDVTEDTLCEATEKTSTDFNCISKSSEHLILSTLLRLDERVMELSNNFEALKKNCSKAVSLWVSQYNSTRTDACCQTEEEPNNMHCFQHLKQFAAWKAKSMMTRLSYEQQSMNQ